MKRLILASIVLVSVAACFDFDGAYNQYCQRNNCDGGTGGGLNPTGGGLTTGGGLAGGSTAGGDAAGGTSAGGAGGGSTAGGAAAGGSAGASAGGSAIDAGVDAGMPDAGVMCTGAPFCVHRQTQRTDFKGADAVFGTTLDNGGALSLPVRHHERHHLGVTRARRHTLDWHHPIVHRRRTSDGRDGPDEHRQ